jgi:hypothetical protein
MARPYGRAIYAATIPRAKSTQPSAAAPSRPRFLNLLYQFKGLKMTKSEFIAICNEKTIAPALALENDDVRQALRLDDVFWLIAILDNQF